MYRISALLLFFILFWIGVACAQNTDITVSELFVRYKKSQPDSNQVRILLRIDSMYLYKMPDSTRILDSAILLASQAAEQSLRIGFRRGRVDATFLLANAYAEKNDFASAIKIANAAAGVDQIHMFIMIGERYVFKPGELPANLDKAYPFIIAAIDRSRKANLSMWYDRGVCLLGKYYFARGHFNNGKDCFIHLINKYHRRGDYRQEANWWSELGRYYPDRENTYLEKEKSMNKALEIYRILKDKPGEAETLEQLAYLFQAHGKLLMAESYLLKSTVMRKALGRKHFYEQYSALAHIYNIRGDYNKTLYYALAAVNNIEAIGEKYMTGVIYAQLADTYRSLGETDKSLRWYYLAMENLVGYRMQYRYPISGRIVQALIKKGRYNQALLYIQGFSKTNPTPRLVDREILASSLGDCYRALKRHELAEYYYKQMIAYDNKVREHFNLQLSVDGVENMIIGSEAYYSIGSFYVDMGMFTIGQTYLLNALNITQYPPSLSRKKDIHLLLFRTDSAQGRLHSAIRHYEIHKALNDSLFSIEKIKQIENLLIKYEIARKEKDLNVLKAREQLQAKEIQQSRQAKRFTYVLIVSLIVLIAVGFSRYKLKLRSNRLLQIKQAEINEANAILKHILGEKDQLIVEKDTLLDEKAWLLKEIHHRVKNNLQIVISLLNTQSKFLESKEAKDAIQESTHRMHAMSMIHQKLYHSDGTTLVNMQIYITEFTEYLKTSFRDSGRFHIELNLDKIHVDISQALPVGLILNEIITNAFKYAFPDCDNGRVLISMKKKNDNDVELEVSDNGKGFPEGLNLDANGSMGIRLMKGLARQIGEALVIENHNGVLYRINFRIIDKKAPATTNREVTL